MGLVLKNLDAFSRVNKIQKYKSWRSKNTEQIPNEKMESVLKCVMLGDYISEALVSNLALLVKYATPDEIVKNYTILYDSYTKGEKRKFGN